MLDINGLYSYKNQEPQPLPHEITLSDGRSRTDRETFTEEEIRNAGFTGPYEAPEYDVNTEMLVWDPETLTFSVELIPVVTQPQREFTEEELWTIFRAERDFRLTKSDWALLSDSPLSEDKKQEWISYREKLRNLPSTISKISSMEEIDWPEKPQ